MDITGTYTFNAPPERVWNLLMDPAASRRAFPAASSWSRPARIATRRA